MNRSKRLNNVSPKTIERGKRLILLELGDGEHAISSFSKPDKGYMMTQKNGCACDGYANCGDCAHKKRVEAFLDEREASTD